MSPSGATNLFGWMPLFASQTNSFRIAMRSSADDPILKKDRISGSESGGQIPVIEAAEGGLINGESSTEEHFESLLGSSQDNADAGIVAKPCWRLTAERLQYFARFAIEEQRGNAGKRVADQSIARDIPGAELDDVRVI